MSNKTLICELYIVMHIVFMHNVFVYLDEQVASKTELD